MLDIGICRGRKKLRPWAKKKGLDGNEHLKSHPCSSPVSRVVGNVQGAVVGLFLPHRHLQLFLRSPGVDLPPGPLELQQIIALVEWEPSSVGCSPRWLLVLVPSP